MTTSTTSTPVTDPSHPLRVALQEKVDALVPLGAAGAQFRISVGDETFVSRSGVAGTRGQWRVVEYPTPQMASNAYAKECSRFVSEGFSDYRD